MSFVQYSFDYLSGLYHEEELDYEEYLVEVPEPTAATVEDDEVEEDEPELPPPPSSGRPPCKKCKGPNFSFKSPNCILCRMGLPPT